MARYKKYIVNGIHSLGLFHSAVDAQVGLIRMKNIFLMGMAA